MPTIQEITSILPKLSTQELQFIETTILLLYRKRDESIIYDDEYGVWTEQDQNLAAAEVFKLIDKEEEEESKENAKS